MGRRGTITSAAWLLVALMVGGLGGYQAGRLEGHKATISRLQLEAAGNLGQRVEALSFLRLGDLQEAIRRLEGEAFQLGMSIAANAGGDRGTLAVLKTYMSVTPPTPSRSTQLVAALEGVPVLPPTSCDTGLKQLIVASRGGEGAPFR